MIPFLGIALAADGLRAPAAWSAAVLALALLARSRRLVPPPAWPLWLAWLLWRLVSAAASAEPLRALPAAAAPAAALLVLCWACGAEEQERADGFRLLAAAAPLLALAAFLVPNARFPRTGLLPPYYNYTAAIEAAAIAAVAAAAAHDGLRGRPGVAAATGAAAAIVEIVWVGSRGAALAAAAGATLALWRSRRRAGSIGLAAAAALVLAGLALAPSGRRVLKLDRPWANQRPELWRSALAIASERPWLGVGPAEYGRAYLRHPVVDETHLARYGLRTDHAHSEPLQAAAETGWVGLALLLAAWLWTANAALGDPGGWTREAALAGAAALTVQASVDNLFALPALALWYAAMLGLALPRRAEEHAAIPPWSRAALAGVLALALLAPWPDRRVGRLLERAQTAGWPAANAPLREATRLAPLDPQIYEARARIAMRAGPAEAPAAEASLRRAFALAPYDALYPEMLAELAAGRRDWTQALAWARAAAALEPDFLEARLLAAEALLRKGDRRGASAAVLQLQAARARLKARPAPSNDYETLIGYLDGARYRRLLERLGLEAEPIGETG